MKWRLFSGRGLTAMVVAFMLALLLIGAESVGPPAYRVLALAPGDGDERFAELAPLGTAFTYQGRLLDGEVPVNADCSLQYELYDAAVDGTLVAGPVVPVGGNPVPVADGYVAALVDFGPAVFAGDARWLSVEVRCPTDEDWVPMAGRVTLNATPYALYALAGPWVGLTGMPAGFADGADNDLLGSLTCGGGQVAKRGATEWICAADETDDTVTWPEISGMVGTGSTEVAAGDHAHSDTYSPVDHGHAGEEITSGTVADARIDAALARDGEVMTLVLAGDGAGSGLDADLLDGQHGDYYQRRVSGSCGSGEAIAVIHADGTVFCQPLDAATWRLSGNAGTNPGTNYLGTSDNQALELRVNGTRALRLEPNATSPNMLGGYGANWLAAGVFGATIGGGGGSGNLNRVTGIYGTVGGGRDNQAGATTGSVTDALAATVCGGQQNAARASYDTVAGGLQNTASGGRSTVGGGYLNIASGQRSTVGGGYGNNADGDWSTVGGGFGNAAMASYATVGGGNDNAAIGSYSTVGGGIDNSVSGYGAAGGGGSGNIISGTYSTVGGGYHNTAGESRSTVGGGAYNQASGWYATVPGGKENIAKGDFSLAAGHYAQANNPGCFVWGDSTETTHVTCNTDNRWKARASGGVYFLTNAGQTSGVYVVAGGNAWSSVSDRNLKDNITPVDFDQLLDRLAQVPVTTWNYKSQDDSIRHIGPMAQDFYAAFGVGEDDKAITTIDADGVTLAAVQALYALSQDQSAQMTALSADNASLHEQVATLTSQLELERARLDGLDARLAALELAGGDVRGINGGTAPPLLAGAGLLVAGLAAVWVSRRNGSGPFKGEEP